MRDEFEEKINITSQIDLYNVAIAIEPEMNTLHDHLHICERARYVVKCVGNQKCGGKYSETQTSIVRIDFGISWFS